MAWCKEHEENLVGPGEIISESHSRKWILFKTSTYRDREWTYMILDFQFYCPHSITSLSPISDYISLNTCSELLPTATQEWFSQYAPI